MTAQKHICFQIKLHPCASHASIMIQLVQPLSPHTYAQPHPSHVEATLTMFQHYPSHFPSRLKAANPTHPPPPVLRQNCSTHPSCKSAVFQSSNNKHGINSVLEFGRLLCFTVSVTQLGDQNVKENYNHHRHVCQKNKDSQSANRKTKQK